MIKVLVFGTFDGLHAGHVNFFKQAKKLGDHLIAVVAKDKTVEKTKGHLPHLDEKERLAAVADNKLIDEARLGYLGDHYKIVKEIKPDVIALGYDQKAFTDDLASELKKAGISAKIVRLKPYKPKVCHSRLIKKHAGKPSLCK